MKYCKNCKQKVGPIKSKYIFAIIPVIWFFGTMVFTALARTSFWISLLGPIPSLLAGVAGVVIAVLIYGTSEDKCPICKGTDWK